MRILISIDNYCAPYYYRLGIARAFSAAEHEVVMWDINKKPVYDAFDEFEPHLFIGQSYNITPGLIECLTERPYVKVVMNAGDYGEMTDIMGSKYPVGKATEEEINNVRILKERIDKPDFVYIHHHKDWLKQTHGKWDKMGIKSVSLINAADIFAYSGGKHKEELASDICFIGGYWPYKAQVLDKYVLPLCNGKYNIKIFGNQPWPVPQYCGNIDESYVPDLLKSAKVCINLHEPHSQDLGYDIIERPFKLLSNRCFVLSDYVEGLNKLFFNDEIAFADSPESFFDKLDYFLSKTEERESYAERGFLEVIAKHTYFDRAIQICRELYMEHLVEDIELAKQQTIKALKI